MFVTTFVAIVLSIQPQLPAANIDVHETVKKGLKWLAGQQAKDGSWGGNSDLYRTTTTATAGLALLMEGSTLKEGPYAANIRKAVEWYLANARPNGLLVAATDRGDNGRSTYAHASALLFLASAYDLDDDETRRKRVGKLLDAAVAYAATERAAQGGWGSVPRNQNAFEDTYTTSHMLDSMLLADRVGIKVPDKLIESATRYLTIATNREGGLVYSVAEGIQPRGGDGQPQPTAGAAALAVGIAHRPEHFTKWVAFAAKTRPALVARVEQQSDSMTLLHTLQVARLSHSLGDSGHRQLDPAAREADLLLWSPYRKQVFAKLKKLQNTDGSWPDSYVGPAQSTGLALTILQLENNYLPAFSK